jgi:hypothetical protein
LGLGMGLYYRLYYGAGLVGLHSVAAFWAQPEVFTPKQPTSAPRTKFVHANRWQSHDSVLLRSFNAGTN